MDYILYHYRQIAADKAHCSSISVWRAEAGSHQLYIPICVALLSSPCHSWLLHAHDPVRLIHLLELSVVTVGAHLHFCHFERVPGRSRNEFRSRKPQFWLGGVGRSSSRLTFTLANLAMIAILVGPVSLLNLMYPLKMRKVRVLSQTLA